MPVLVEIADQTPLSETEPEEADANDEDDMGMTYPMLSRLGSMRKARAGWRAGSFSAAAFVLELFFKASIAFW